MDAIVRHIKGNFTQWIALSILVFAMFAASRGAALPALWALGRFVLPVLVIWLVFRLIKSRVSRAVQKFQEQMMQGMNAPGARTNGAGRQVLDLCPKCGTLMTAGHRCK
jgi:hypothetical protein